MCSRVHRVSPDLWGVFYEEIGFSGQGGVHQEQVFNGNFESFSADYAPWVPYVAPPSSASASPQVQYELLLTQDQPLNAFNPTALQVQTRLSGGSSAVVGLTNPGYWGISTLGRPAFNLSLFARSASVTSITARLVSNTSQQALAEAELRVGRQWAKSTATLHVSAEVDDALLQLTWTSGSRTSLYLDVISLLPTSHYSSVSFLRPDLGSLVAEMRPSVVRLPGGCYVEGGRLNNRFNWKRAVGPIEKRRGHENDVWVSPHLSPFASARHSPAWLG